MIKTEALNSKIDFMKISQMINDETIYNHLKREIQNIIDADKYKETGKLVNSNYLHENVYLNVTTFKLTFHQKSGHTVFIYQISNKKARLRTDLNHFYSDKNIDIDVIMNDIIRLIKKPLIKWVKDSLQLMSTPNSNLVNRDLSELFINLSTSEKIDYFSGVLLNDYIDSIDLKLIEDNPCLLDEALNSLIEKGLHDLIYKFNVVRKVLNQEQIVKLIQFMILDYNDYYNQVFKKTIIRVLTSDSLDQEIIKTILDVLKNNLIELNTNVFNNQTIRSLSYAKSTEKENSIFLYYKILNHFKIENDFKGCIIQNIESVRSNEKVEAYQLDVDYLLKPSFDPTNTSTIAIQESINFITSLMESKTTIFEITDTVQYLVDLKNTLRHMNDMQLIKVDPQLLINIDLYIEKLNELKSHGLLISVSYNDLEKYDYYLNN